MQDVTGKSGRRMTRTLQKHLWLFSEKQQRTLKQCEISTAFSEELQPPPKDSKTAQGSGDKQDLMEEMMARCRDFVREKSGTFDERQREADRQKKAERRKARLEEEWRQIDVWHRKLLQWEWKRKKSKRQGELHWRQSGRELPHQPRLLRHCC